MRLAPSDEHETDRGAWMTRGWIPVLLVPVAAGLCVGAAAGLPEGLAGWAGWLGRVTGTVGLACMLLAAVISVRVPGVDRLFGGLPRLWKLHHGLGLAALVLVLTHPPLMTLAAFSRGPAAMEALLTPSASDLAMWAGWAAVLAMIVFLAPSFRFFGNPEYQRWKGLHFVAGLALVMALVHTLMLPRSLSPLAHTLLWGTLGGLAVLVFLWRASIARPLLRRAYRIAGRETVAPDVVELSLQSDNGGIDAFRPGQLVYLVPEDESLPAGRNEEHPYTISSAPGEPVLRIAVKAQGDATSALQQVTTGSRARVEGPYGDFLPPRLRQRPQLWIAGGIGITPFLSAVRAMGEGVSWGDVDLFYCTDDSGRAHFLEELQAIAEQLPGLRIHPHYFREQGLLDAEFLRDRCNAPEDRDWYVCGPLGLNQHARRLARTMGVPRRRIRTEEFVFL